jgi:hypothetical protein
LPAGLRGSLASENHTLTGTLKPARRDATCSWMLGLGHRHARAQVHDGADLFAEDRMRDTDDGGLGDRGCS